MIEKFNGIMKLSMIVLLSLLMIQPLSIEAQSVGGVDLKSVRVDDLSDEQILSYVRQAEERGLTQAQLEALARQRGVSEIEISKLRRRVQILRGGLGSSTSQDSLGRSIGRGLQPVVSDDIFGSLAGETGPTLTEEQKRIFWL